MRVLYFTDASGCVLLLLNHAPPAESAIICGEKPFLLGSSVAFRREAREHAGLEGRR